MKVTVLYFGVSQDIAGKRSEVIELLAGGSVADLRKQLQAAYPALDSSLAYAMAVNEMFSQDDKLLSDGDVAAVLPPVSGG